VILFEKQGQRRVPFFGFIIYFSLKKSTGNSQGLMRFSNNSASWSMYKERKRIMSTSFDSISIFQGKFFGLDKSKYFPKKIM